MFKWGLTNSLADVTVTADIDVLASKFADIAPMFKLVKSRKDACTQNFKIHYFMTTRRSVHYSVHCLERSLF